MPRVTILGSILDILRSFLTSHTVQHPLRTLFALWLYIKRHIFRNNPRRPKSDGRNPQQRERFPDSTIFSELQGSQGDAGGCGHITICASRDPRSSLQLDEPSMTQVNFPNRPSSMSSFPMYQAPGHTEGMLYPGYHLNRMPSRSSVASGATSARRSVSSTVEERHAPGPGPRASARGLSRIASANPRASTHSRSRSRVRSSRNSSVIELHVESGSEATRSATDVATPTAVTTVPPPSPREPTPTPSSFGRWIYPIIEIQRYERNICIPRADAKFDLQPVTTAFELENVPQGWVPYVHPEGALYFFHPEKRIYTDANLCDEATFNEIHEFMRLVDATIKEKQACGVHLPPDIDLVLELEDDRSGSHNWCYYFADHTSHTLVWLHPYELTWELSNITGSTTLPHLKFRRNTGESSHVMIQPSSKWLMKVRGDRNHIEMFPHNREIPETLFKELTSNIVYHSLDRTTSLTSTISYTPDELDRMLTLSKRLQTLENNEYTACAFARLMNILCKFMNYHGQYGARLCRDQSVHGPIKNSRTLLISTFAPFLFNAPDVHLRSLDNLWVDRTIAYSAWSHFMGKLQTEWQEFILYSTVLLNANVAFLAIPSVDTGNQNLTPAQIASYTSIITSIGSIILGLLLIRQNRVKSRETANDAARYLISLNHPTLGLETLAIVYSLPYALLMWGMVTFLLAFSFECFDNPDHVTNAVTGVLWCIVGLLVCWCLYTGWEIEDQSTWTKITDLYTRTASGVRERAKAVKRWRDALRGYVSCSPRIREETASAVDTEV